MRTEKMFQRVLWEDQGNIAINEATALGLGLIVTLGLLNLGKDFIQRSNLQVASLDNATVPDSGRITGRGRHFRNFVPRDSEQDASTSAVPAAPNTTLTPKQSPTRLPTAAPAGKSNPASPPVSNSADPPTTTSSEPSLPASNPAEPPPTAARPATAEPAANTGSVSATTARSPVVASNLPSASEPALNNSFQSAATPFSPTSAFGNGNTIPMQPFGSPPGGLNASWGGGYPSALPGLNAMPHLMPAQPNFANELTQQLMDDYIQRRVREELQLALFAADRQVTAPAPSTNAESDHAVEQSLTAQSQIDNQSDDVDTPLEQSTRPILTETDAIQVFGIDRSFPERLRLIVVCHRNFRQLQVHFAEEKLAFRAPPVGQTATIPLPAACLAPGAKIKLFGIEDDSAEYREWTVSEQAQKP